MSVLLFLLLVGEPDDLVARLASDDLDARDEAAARLGVLGAAAFPALEKALGHSDAEVRARAVDVLKRSWAALPPEMIARQPMLRAEFVALGVEDYFRNASSRVAATSREQLLASEPLRKLQALGPDAIPLLLQRIDNMPVQVAAGLALWDDARSARALDDLSRSTTVFVISGR